MASKKQQKREPMVNSVAGKLRRTVKSANDTAAATPEETRQRKTRLLGILDTASTKFLEELNAGNAELKSSADLERIIKLTLLLSGEADTIKGNASTEEVIESDQVAAQHSMSKITQILDPNDPDVKNMFNKIYEGYNKLNDEEDTDLD